MNITENLKTVRSVIEHTKHEQQNVNIVAATKYVDAETIKMLYSEGLVMMGENRVESLLEKKEKLSDMAIEWHFIGTLQTKKVKRVINEIDCLHSLDRLNLAKEIQSYRQSALPCFVQVNVSNESSKHGITSNEVEAFIQELQQYNKIKVIGLMTMAPLEATDEEVRLYFQQLREIQLKINKMKLSHAPCHSLSMGMSNDYAKAIEEHATHIRLGSVLFQD